MPWVPELFSAPALANLEDKRRRQKDVAVPYFDGMLAGETDALIESFAGEPELHHPVRGRVRGVRAFEAFVEVTRSWFEHTDASVEQIDRIITEDRGVEEVVLHVESETRQAALPMAIVADRRPDGRIDELRIYYSTWPVNGRHTHRPPVLQPDAELSAPDVVGEYQRALAAGDVDAILAAFEPDGYAREPADVRYVHRGHEGLREFYEWLCSNDGGIPLEHCAVTHDRRACALEYNVLRWGKTELQPQAGIAVYVRGESGKLAAARIYDDVDPPLRAAT